MIRNMGVNEKAQLSVLRNGEMKNFKVILKS